MSAAQLLVVDGAVAAAIGANHLWSRARLTVETPTSELIARLQAREPALALVEPVVAPVPDPVSLDATRPVDLDVCPVCDGLGGYAVVTHDPYDDATDGVECWSCAGTGERGAA